MASTRQLEEDHYEGGPPPKKRSSLKSEEGKAIQGSKRTYIKHEEWEPHKDFVLQMRLAKAKEVEILAALRDERGFHVELHQLKKVLQVWKSRRNLKRKQRDFIIRTVKERKRAGKTDTIFYHPSGTIIDQPEVKELMRRYGNSQPVDAPSPGGLVVGTPGYTGPEEPNQESSNSNNGTPGESNGSYSTRGISSSSPGSNNSPPIEFRDIVPDINFNFTSDWNFNLSTMSSEELEVLSELMQSSTQSPSFKQPSLFPSIDHGLDLSNETIGQGTADVPYMFQDDFLNIANFQIPMPTQSVPKFSEGTEATAWENIVPFMPLESKNEPDIMFAQSQSMAFAPPPSEETSIPYASYFAAPISPPSMIPPPVRPIRARKRSMAAAVTNSATPSVEQDIASKASMEQTGPVEASSEWLDFINQPENPRFPNNAADFSLTAPITEPMHPAVDFDMLDSFTYSAASSVPPPPVDQSVQGQAVAFEASMARAQTTGWTPPPAPPPTMQPQSFAPPPAPQMAKPKSSQGFLGRAATALRSRFSNPPSNRTSDIDYAVGGMSPGSSYMAAPPSAGSDFERLSSSVPHPAPAAFVSPGSGPVPPPLPPRMPGSGGSVAPAAPMMPPMMPAPQMPASPLSLSSMLRTEERSKPATPTPERGVAKRITSFARQKVSELSPPDASSSPRSISAPSDATDSSMDVDGKLEDLADKYPKTVRSKSQSFNLDSFKPQKKKSTFKLDTTSPANKEQGNQTPARNTLRDRWVPPSAASYMSIASSRTSSYVSVASARLASRSGKPTTNPTPPAVPSPVLSLQPLKRRVTPQARDAKQTTEKSHSVEVAGFPKHPERPPPPQPDFKTIRSTPDEEDFEYVEGDAKSSGSEEEFTPISATSIDARQFKMAPMPIPKNPISLENILNPASSSSPEALSLEKSSYDSSSYSSGLPIQSTYEAEEAIKVKEEEDDDILAQVPLHILRVFDEEENTPKEEFPKQKLRIQSTDGHTLLEFGTPEMDRFYRRYLLEWIDEWVARAESDARESASEFLASSRQGYRITVTSEDAWDEPLPTHICESIKQRLSANMEIDEESMEGTQAKLWIWVSEMHTKLKDYMQKSVDTDWTLMDTQKQAIIYHLPELRKRYGPNHFFTFYAMSYLGSTCLWEQLGLQKDALRLKNVAYQGFSSIGMKDHCVGFTSLEDDMFWKKWKDHSPERYEMVLQRATEYYNVVWKKYGNASPIGVYAIANMVKALMKVDTLRATRTMPTAAALLRSFPRSWRSKSDVLYAAAQLGDSMCHIGKPAEASKLMTDILIDCAASQTESSDLLKYAAELIQSVVNSYEIQEKWLLVLEFRQRLLLYYKDLYGWNHPNTLANVNKISHAMEMRGFPMYVLPTLKVELKMAERIYGQEDRRTDEVLMRYGNAVGRSLQAQFLKQEDDSE